LNPAHIQAQWNLGLCQLTQGDLENGWRQYEWRWKNPELDVFQENRSFAEPRWDGTQSLEGKTVLLYSEQGLGDTLQFCRYAKEVSGRGAKVILEVLPPLLRLMEGAEGVFAVAERGKPLPPFDYQCPLMSVPLTVKTQLNTIPASASYLRAKSADVAQWAQRIAPSQQLRVGIVWSGRASQANNHNRSMHLREMLALQIPGVELVSLQKEMSKDDEKVLKKSPHVLHFGAHLHDMADTAALCEQVDVVVSVCTSVAHLAGALGRPLCVLLPFVPDWRWLLDRTDSPWYPSARLFRQTKALSWAEPIESLKLHLSELVAQRAATAQSTTTAHI
jgi:hypothetical protein